MLTRGLRTCCVVLTVSMIGALAPMLAPPVMVSAEATTTPIVIDTSSRKSVLSAYRGVLRPALAVPITWSGSTAACNEGAPSASAQQATLDALNFVRAMGGLQPVSFDATFSAQAQRAALMMSAASSLSHNPAPSWPCYSADGALGASRSNLALGGSGARAILQYMADGGSNNFSVGHRQWIMKPQQTVMGSGSTSNANALYVVDPPSWRATLLPTDPTWAAWPTSGYFPSQLEPAGRWSLSTNSGVTDFAAATVTVTRHDVGSDVVMQPTVLTRAGNLLVWQFDPGFRSGFADRRYTVTVDNIVRDGMTSSRTYDVTVFDADVEPGQPARLLDTRLGERTVDSQFAGLGLRAAGSVLELQVADRVGTPADASAALLNVTVTDARGPGFVTVYPCGRDRPTASNLNYVNGSTVANTVVAQLGAGGRVCLYVSFATHLLVDINGLYRAPIGYAPIAPSRLLDTRSGQTTIDGQSNGVGAIRGGTSLELPVAGRAGVPGNATSVVLNVTSTQAIGPGFLTVFPCGQPRPLASSVNFLTNLTVPNAVIARLGAGGTICIFASSDTDVVVDISGVFDATSPFTLTTPARLLDTRPGFETIDGADAGIGLRPAGSVTTLVVAGRAGIPAGATTVALNVTVTDAALPGYVTVFPCGQQRPLASNLNYMPGAAVANAVIATVGQGGAVCLFTLVDAHLIVDVSGHHSLPLEG